MSEQAKQVVLLLESSLNSDNAVRKQAEAQLTQASNQDPEAFMNSLLEIFATPSFKPEQRANAMIHYKVLLRDFFLGRDNSIWTKVSAQHKANSKDQLLLIMLSPETDLTVRRPAVALIADIASVLLSPETSNGENWDELVPRLIQSISSGVGPATPHITNLLSEIAPFISEKIASESSGFAQICRTLIEGQTDLDTKIAAIKLVCTIACETVEHRDAWGAFQPMIPMMMAFYEKTAQGCLLDESNNWKQYDPEADDEYDDAVQYAMDLVESLIDLSDRASAFLKPNIAQVFECLFAVIRTAHADEDLRKYTGEIVLAILTDKPKMCKSVEGFNKMMIETSILLMLTVTEEDLNDTNDNSEPLFTLGERGIDYIVKAMGGQEMFPILFGYVKTLIESDKWQERYAGISCICQTTEYIAVQDREPTLRDLMPVVIRALNDTCWMVRVAACRCVGQMAYDLPPVFQVHHTEEVLQNLILRFDDDHPEVVQKALRAYTNFTDELTSTDIEPYMNELLKRFHRLVNAPFISREKRKEIANVRENAITAISVTASVAEKKFIPYYGEIAPVILQILQDFNENDENAEYLRIVRAQAVDCISHIGLAVGKETFAQDGVHVMKILIALRTSKIRDDDPVIEYLYETFKRMVYAMEDNFAQFIEPLMKYYIVVLQSRGETVQDYTDVPNYLDYSFHAGANGIQAMKTSVIIEIIQALSLINTMIEQCKEAFIPVLKPTLEAIVPLMKYQLAHEAVAGVLDVLASCLKLMNQMAEKNQIPSSEITQLLELIVQDSFALLGDDNYIKELIENATFLCAVADGIASCLLNAGKNTLPDSLVDLIAKKTFAILAISTEQRNLHLRHLQDPGLDEEDIAKIMEEGQMQQGFRSSLLSMLGGVMNSHPESYMRISAGMTIEFLENCLKSSNEQDICLGLFLCDDIVQYLADHGHPLWPHFINQLIEGVASPMSSARQAAAYGIVWAARQSAFNEAMVKAVVPKLAQCISMNDPNDDEIQLATDNAIAAVNVLLINKGQFLSEDESRELSKEMFNNFPLVVDNKENICMTELLFESIDANNVHILGKNNSNVPAIIASFAKMYKTLLSEDSLDLKIAEFLRKIGPEGINQQLPHVPAESHKYVERMIKDVL